MKSDLVFIVEQYFTKHDDWFEAIHHLTNDINRCITQQDPNIKTKAAKNHEWVIASDRLPEILSNMANEHFEFKG